MIITYNDAEITFDAGGDWSPGQAATVTVNDPDQNKNPASAETLSVGDETATIPTIKMGTGGLTLAEGVNLSAGTVTVANPSTKVNIGASAYASSDPRYTLQINNTTDNSERLRITHLTEAVAMTSAAFTWINVTTGHTVAEVVNLGGTVVLSYDISAPADLVSSTGIEVYVTTDGNNETDNKVGSIDIVTAGNVKSGVYDLEGGANYGHIVNTDRMDAALGTSAGTALISVAFKLTHAAGNDMSATADYAIYADFCNFDQDNGSLTHNCMYRLEAVETGADTGIFEGTVEYINLTNSTTGGTTSGEHDGNDHEVEDLLGYVKGDALSVVLMDSVSW